MRVEEMVNGEVANQIVCDVGNNVPPEKSKLTYGPVELEFRKGVEKRFAEFKKSHPNAIMDVRE